MTIDIRVFPDQGLVYVRYSGVARLEETMQAFSAFMADPHAVHVYRHLVDMHDLRSAAFDFPALMRVQAKKAEHFLRGDIDTLIAYYAPTRDALKLANMAQRSWGEMAGLVSRTFEDEAATMAFLGLADGTLSDLRGLAMPR